jgi:hypothetical protein
VPATAPASRRCAEARGVGVSFGLRPSTSLPGPQYDGEPERNAMRKVVIGIVATVLLAAVGIFALLPIKVDGWGIWMRKKIKTDLRTIVSSSE